MISNNKKYVLMVICGLFILSKGVRSFHFIPFESGMYSPSYALGKNLGLILRVFLGLWLITKGILYLKENKVR